MAIERKYGVVILENPSYPLDSNLIEAAKERTEKTLIFRSVRRKTKRRSISAGKQRTGTVRGALLDTPGCTQVARCQNLTLLSKSPEVPEEGATFTCLTSNKLSLLSFL